jgi:hypothetical protein
MGNDALANGWLARARDLLDGYPDSIEWGWVALVESEQAVDPTSALEHAEQALAVARQTRDSDLELAAPGRAGLAEIALGRIEAGVTSSTRAWPPAQPAKQLTLAPSATCTARPTWPRRSPWT